MTNAFEHEMGWIFFSLKKCYNWMSSMISADNRPSSMRFNLLTESIEIHFVENGFIFYLPRQWNSACFVPNRRKTKFLSRTLRSTFENCQITIFFLLF